jgi:urease accessory protein
MNKLLTAALVVAAGPALAHTGHGDAGGLVHGLEHPLSGMDHLLAMVAVGLWSSFVLPRAPWAGAATFMAAMAAGAGLSWAGIPLPLVETGIVASVVAFGLLTLWARPAQARALTGASLAMIGLFAAFHGHAHAAEAVGNAAAYLAGFLVSTAGLHLAGIGIARAVAGNLLAQRAMGAAVAGSGLWLAPG